MHTEQRWDSQIFSDTIIIFTECLQTGTPNISETFTLLWTLNQLLSRNCPHQLIAPLFEADFLSRLPMSVHRPVPCDEGGFTQERTLEDSLVSVGEMLSTRAAGASVRSVHSILLIHFTTADQTSPSLIHKTHGPTCLHLCCISNSCHPSSAVAVMLSVSSNSHLLRTCCRDTLTLFCNTHWTVLTCNDPTLYTFCSFPCRVSFCLSLFSCPSSSIILQTALHIDIIAAPAVNRGSDISSAQQKQRSAPNTVRCIVVLDLTKRWSFLVIELLE